MRGPSLECRPQLACLQRFPACGEPTSLEERADQRLETLGSCQRHAPHLSRNLRCLRSSEELALRAFCYQPSVGV